MCLISLHCNCTVHRGVFFQSLVRLIYYYDGNKSTGKEPGKTHLCEMCWLMQFNETPWPYTDMLLYAYWGCRLYRKNCKKVLCVERIKRNSKRNARMWLQKKLFNILTRVRSFSKEPGEVKPYRFKEIHWYYILNHRELKLILYG